MEMLSLEKIKVNNPYLRTETDIKSLKKSIETIGLINPLTINKDNELLAGGRRYQAMIELGMEEAMVYRVNLSVLEQELISIDENLVRCPLNKLELEQCLNRGRDIYEQLNPTATKIDITVKNQTAKEKKQERLEDEDDTTSFAAVTSEKTGLSKSVIKNAIKRDAQSSEVLKEARGNGEVSAGQVNEIIRLDKKLQDKILPYVKDKTVKEVRKIVERAREEGIDNAITESLEMQELPREFMQLDTMVKRCNKQLSKIIVENIHIEGEELDKIVVQVEKLKQQSKDFLKLFADENSSFVAAYKIDSHEENSYQ